MTTNYDPIAEQYKRAKRQPWRAHIEAYTLMGLQGDLSGESLVDVACGDGYYARRLRALGAAKVRGVDLSPRMIELGRERESQHALGIESAFGREFWSVFLDHSPITFIECVK
jgi:ubiquinone/menaquinone biosynthesis C-methylase UbiE